MPHLSAALVLFSLTLNVNPSFFKEMMVEVSRREREAGIIPDPDIDTYMKVVMRRFRFSFLTFFYNGLVPTSRDFSFNDMLNGQLISKQAISVAGQERNLQTDYVLKVHT